MERYSILKRTAQYALISIALLAGIGAGSQNESIDSKVRYVRKPREACVLPPDHRQPEKPVNPGPVYFGLAALAVAYVANEMRKKADERLAQKIRPDSPKYFFGDEEVY